jgi:lysophospholipase L1-like esterase
MNKMKPVQTISLIAVSLILWSFNPFQKKITVFSIGDSTMCNYGTSDNYPLRGWMMMMGPMFNDKVVVNNAASSGRSSKSFREEGRWKKVIEEVQPGDYVFIQFGHNDEKKDSARHTDARTSFRQNLLNYVNETQAKGAHPVLVTSIVRRQFDSTTGKLADTHGDYVTVVRELAEKINIPLIDLNKKTAQMVEGMGAEASKKLYLYLAPGQHAKAPGGKKDDTHLCEYGAIQFAELAAESLIELNLPLARYLIPGRKGQRLNN